MPHIIDRMKILHLEMRVAWALFIVDRINLVLDHDEPLLFIEVLKQIKLLFIYML